ncbi:MAG: queuosine precursor transporter, partial [Oscillospiraceae bacterium]
MEKQVSENPVKNREVDMSLVIISGLLVTMYLIANIMAVKVIYIFGYSLFDAGTITFPFAYMLGDVLTEAWGFKTAKKVIWLTFFCNIILVISTTIGIFLPSPEYMLDTANAYATVFHAVPRIVVGSRLAFFAGELINSYAKEKIKIFTNGKYLWVRTIGSSIIGYLFDTIIFVLIAFAGIAPTRDLISMIVIQYFVKLLIEAIGGTPLAYF